MIPKIILAMITFFILYPLLFFIVMLGIGIFLFAFVYLWNLTPEVIRCKKCGGQLIKEKINFKLNGKEMGRFKGMKCASCKEEYFSKKVLEKIKKKNIKEVKDEGKNERKT